MMTRELVGTLNEIAGTEGLEAAGAAQAAQSRIDRMEEQIEQGGGSGGAVPGDEVEEETSYGLAPSGGNATTYSRSNHSHGTPALGDATPQAPGTPTAGSSSLPSRQDHVHPTPTGFALSNHNHDGTYSPVIHDHDDRYYTEAQADARFATSAHSHSYEAFGAVAAHEALGNPHPIYLTEAEGDGRYSLSGHTHPGGGGGPTYIKRTSDAAPVTTTAFASDGVLSVPVLASTDYDVEFFVIYQSAATTTGARFGVTGPASPTLQFLESKKQVTAGGTASSDMFFTGILTAYDQALPASTAEAAANTNTLCVIRGTFRNGNNAGNLTLRVASEIAGSGITVKAGSRVRYQVM